MIIEERGTTPEGLPYVIVVLTELGTRNGYVGVFSDSELYDKPYEQPLSGIENDYASSISFNIGVHGGLTYSGALNQHIIGAENPYYFGFDCAHLGDAKISLVEMEYIIKTYATDLTDSEKQHIINRYNMLSKLIHPYGEEQVRSTDYVREHCFSLSTQLKEMEKKRWH